MSKGSERKYISVQPHRGPDLSGSASDDLSVAVGADLQRILAKRHYPAADAPGRVGMPQRSHPRELRPLGGEGPDSQRKRESNRSRFDPGAVATAGVLALAGTFGFLLGAFGSSLPEIFSDRAALERTFRLPDGLGAGDRLAVERRAAPLMGHEVAGRLAGTAN